MGGGEGRGEEQMVFIHKSEQKTCISMKLIPSCTPAFRQQTHLQPAHQQEKPGHPQTNREAEDPGPRPDRRRHPRVPTLHQPLPRIPARHPLGEKQYEHAAAASGADTGREVPAHQA